MHSTSLFTIADAMYREQLRAKFLADAIPATSFAAGANRIESWLNDKNVNYDNCVKEGWSIRDNGRWLHSDIKDVAYFLISELFKRIVKNEGGENDR